MAGLAAVSLPRWRTRAWSRRLQPAGGFRRTHESFYGLTARKANLNFSLCGVDHNNFTVAAPCREEIFRRHTLPRWGCRGRVRSKRRLRTARAVGRSASRGILEPGDRWRGAGGLLLRRAPRRASDSDDASSA